MHGYSRLGRPNGSSPSPPSSPRQRRPKGGGGFRGGGNAGVEIRLQSFIERWVYMVISAVYRRRGVLLFAPLLYVSAMLLYMGTIGGFDVGGFTSKNSAGSPPPLGSLYRSPQVFQHLWPFIEAENSNRSNDLVRVFVLMTLFVSICYIIDFFALVVC